MKRSLFHRFWLVLAIVAIVVPQSAGIVGATQPAAPPPPNQPNRPTSVGDDSYVTLPSSTKNQPDAGDQDDPYAREDAFYSRRIAGDPAANFTMGDAAVARANAAQQLLAEKGQTPSTPSGVTAYGGAWTPVGPNPLLGVTRTSPPSFYALSGRIGALAIRSTTPYTMYLGAAQGGVWISSTNTSQWSPVTDQAASLAIGAIALAPSNEDIVYAGTGEGALSGDSYFGYGVLKSIDAGNTFTQVSGSTFNEVSISKIAISPTNPDTLYVATIRGRGGAKRVTPPNPTPYGIWKSIDGGVHWTGVNTTTNESHGATDLVMDPLNANILYASFWGQGISKTVDGGLNWVSVMNGFPGNADYTLAPTRFALGISHPSALVSATLYSGFEFFDTTFAYHEPTIWKSTNEAGSWSQTADLNPAPNSVTAYCENGGSSQCFYDNVIGVDPSNANIVYALGLFDYTGGQGAGGIFRSNDGGDHWVNLGYGLHPDYHAIAIRTDNPANILIGNDGGVWASADRGGRPNGIADPLSAVTWVDLNGTVNPSTGQVLGSSGLQIAQFTSIDTNPTIPNRFYGGTQDNGTLRKVTSTSQWTDFSSGDGGQVNVDPTDGLYVYGTYFDVSPYRFTDGMGITTGSFFTNQALNNGLHADRSDFYIPVILDPGNPNRLYLGTYRVYRADNAKAPLAGDVLWQVASPDLTSGCTGTAPNGARGCFISALGASAGGPALYTGSLDGLIYFTPDATAASPVWTRVDISGTTPARPVASIAVDRSNYRVAYAGFNGFNDATPSTHGHVFKTIDAGQHWTDISSNLPDNPVNSIVIDPSDPNTLYVGTDVGPLVTTNGGTSWGPLGTGFPVEGVWQLALNPFTRQIVAGTHGRGAWKLTDNATLIPALQIRKSTPGTPVGPGGLLTYTLTVENHGTITATAVTITDVVPANTTFVSASSGGAPAGGNVIWSGLTVPVGTQISAFGGLAPGTVVVTLTVQVSNGATTGQVITNDGYSVTSAEGVGAVGSPYLVAVSPASKPVLTPASQADGTRVGQVITYQVTLQNLGFASDDYTLSTAGNAWPTTFWDATFTTPLTHTGNLASAGSIALGIKVSVPLTATSGLTDTATLKAASVGHPPTNATATVQTTAVTNFILLVDNDNNNPDVSGIYAAGLQGTGFTFDTWDLAVASTIPPNYMKAHKAVVWFTGASYPDPLGPYESELAGYLDQGGRLFVSGQDILDQTAGQAPFMQDYLHVSWDGTEAFNDTGTFTVTGVITSPVTSGFGSVPLDFTLFGGVDFSDVITPTSPAIPAFTGIYGRPGLNGLPDALSVSSGSYKVVFLAFPYEVMGTAADRAELMRRVIHYFGLQQRFFPKVDR